MLAGGKRLSTTVADSVDRGVDVFFKTLFYLIGNYYICGVCNFLYYIKVYLNPPRLGVGG